MAFDGLTRSECSGSVSAIINKSRHPGPRFGFLSRFSAHDSWPVGSFVFCLVPKVEGFVTHEQQVDLRNAIRYVQQAFILFDPVLNSRLLVIGHILLALLSLFVDDDVSPWAVSFALVAAALRSGTGGIAFDPRSVDELAQLL